MKNINRIKFEIAGLEYRNGYGCVELRLFLLGVLHDMAKQYQQAGDKSKVNSLVKSFKELEALYKSFTALTDEDGKNYKAQFEFTKTLVTDHIERLYPAQQLMHVA